MPRTLFRKTLSAPGLLRLARDSFERIEDPVASRGLGLTDCLMSALAMFSLKYPSLLSFERMPGTRTRFGLTSETCTEWFARRRIRPCVSIWTR